MRLTTNLAVVAAAYSVATLAGKHRALPKRSEYPRLAPRQLPAEPTGVETIITPNGFNITYKEPGICETTPGVKSYSGFVNIAEDVHSFFWFFESRSNPTSDPVTLWLNGGPGSDSMIGLFEELGPCRITENLTTVLNPYAFNAVSNMLFLSQPVGVGFSYGSKEPGSLDPFTGIFLNASQATVDGRYPVINDTAVDTSELAAIAAWEVLQGIYSGLPQLDANITSKTFNLATESYGGHYGPAFFDHFQKENLKIQNGTNNGTLLSFDSLLIINGIINEYIQVPYYPEFSINNTYGIPLYNQTIYDYSQIALNMPNGCLQQIQYCYEADTSTLAGQAICTEAEDMCRDNVEGLYYNFGDRGVYDIRHPYDDPTPESYFVKYLNQPHIQQAIGVDTNYTTDSSAELYYAFQQTGDFVYGSILEDLEEILNTSVRVTLAYGDADYICNWFGGEAVSLALNYTHSSQFRSSGYVPLLSLNGTEYGETREYGNFSFTRVYESGHEVPYYQPVAALDIFNRTINGWDIAQGKVKITGDYETVGNASATHTETSVPLPSATGNSSDAAAAVGKVAAAGAAGLLRR